MKAGRVARTGLWGIARIVSLITAIVVGLIVVGILLVVLEANKSNDIVDRAAERGQVPGRALQGRVLAGRHEDQGGGQLRARRGDLRHHGRPDRQAPAALTLLPLQAPRGRPRALGSSSEPCAHTASALLICSAPSPRPANCSASACPLVRKKRMRGPSGLAHLNRARPSRRASSPFSSLRHFERVARLSLGSVSSSPSEEIPQPVDARAPSAAPRRRSPGPHRSGRVRRKERRTTSKTGLGAPVSSIGSCCARAESPTRRERRPATPARRGSP